MNKFFLIFCFFLSFSSGLFSLERMPWTEEDLVLYPRLEALYQHYNKIQSSKKSEHCNANDGFFTAGISGSYSPWSACAEITAATTEDCHFGLDGFRLTGSYLWMNDIIDESFSVSFGLSYIAAPKLALHDISSFHHGRNEAEIYASVGREHTVHDTWSSRWWTVGLFGLADHGSPWWRLQAFWEKNWCETLIFRFYADGLIGMGGEALNLSRPFKGYGPIKHRSFDLGFRITKTTDCLGTWAIDYAQRVYARNFPANTNLLLISITYPYPIH